MTQLNDLIADKDLILFDLDGTLVTDERHAEAAERWVRNKREQGVISEEQATEIQQTLPRTPITRIAKKFIDPGYDEERAISEYIEAYKACDTPVTIFPGAIESLRLLKERGKIVAAITGGSEYVCGTNVNMLNKAYDGKVFDAIVFNNPGQPMKPDEQAFSRVFSQIVLRLHKTPEPNKTIMVGDSIVDYLFARNIGSRFVYIIGCQEKPAEISGEQKIMGCDTFFDNMQGFYRGLRGAHHG